jgi:hypothetical protein
VCAELDTKPARTAQMRAAARGRWLTSDVGGKGSGDLPRAAW